MLQSDLDKLKKLEDQVLAQLIIKARTDFYTFVKIMAPVVLPDPFVDGVHIRLITKELQSVAESVVDHTRDPERLQLMMPPGSMKSKIASNLFPAWCLGRWPSWCFLAIGADNDFAVDNFGRPTKDLIDSPQYKAVFPNTVLKKDVNSAGRWDTTKKGRFVARGVGQNIAGRRAHISICDDVITEQTNDNGRKEINGWYRKGLRTRLLPRGAEIIINTRWFVEDLSGFMIRIDEKSERPWKIIKIPALLDDRASKMLRDLVEKDDLRFIPGTSFWPEFWPTKNLLEKKATTPPSEWNALYMQDPVMEEGGIIKRANFQIWDLPDPPKCRYIVVSMDTAFSTSESADYSAYTVWGVFTNVHSVVEDGKNININQDCMILLAAGRGRWDFAELCQKAQDLDGKYSPEFFIIEDRASGQSLIPELQKRNLPIVPYKSDKDKAFRLQATTPYFQAQRIWVPSGKGWAEDVVAEVIAFNPRLKNQRDDYTDTVSQAVIWMRDQFKIDNDGYSNRWDDDIKSQRAKTYWSAMTANA